MSIQPWSNENNSLSGPVERPWTAIFRSEDGIRTLSYIDAGTRTDAVDYFRALAGPGDELVSVIYGHHGDCILDVLASDDTVTAAEWSDLDGCINGDALDDRERDALDPSIYATGTES